MRETLLCHAARYPLWLASDVLKLLFQSEFGCGHLVRDRMQCMERLLLEWASAEVFPGVPVLERIGGGFVRAHLGACRTRGVPPDAVCAAFLRTASETPGTLSGFMEKAALAASLFPDMAIRDAAEVWLAAGQPLFSHSSVYHAAYHPAYRVIREELLTL